MSASRPEKWITGTTLFLGHGLSRLELSHNSAETICKEVLDTNLVNLIGKAGDLSDEELKTVQIVRKSEGNQVEIYQIGEPKKAFNILSARLKAYISSREQGHTRQFLLAAITNRMQLLSIPDTDLRVLVLNKPFLPASWLKKVDSGTRTNKAGQIAGISYVTTFVNGEFQTTTTTNLPVVDEICRWVSYTATDGEITWEYVVNFKANGKLDYIYESKRDAKENDPRYFTIMKDVDEEVEAEMKKNGSYGGLGSIHTFWQLKREKLKAKGIEWRSPGELNPNTNYD